MNVSVIWRNVMASQQYNDDPLDQLFVKEKDRSDRKLLAETVLPFASIYQSDDGTYEISLTSRGDSLPSWKKLLVYFLAHKAISFRASEETIREAQTPKQLEEETGLLGGTIRPTLKKLLDDRYLQQDTTGAYFVPNRNLRRISEILAEGEKP
jgi:hypothetical protein